MIDTWNPAKLNEKISGRDSWNPAILNEAVTDRDSWNPAILNESAGETPVVFEATITASFPEGATCTATDGTKTLTADDNPMAFDISNEGTWTVACVANGITFSEDVVINTDGQTETVNLTPDGETVTPTDSVPVLIACAGIGDSEITTIAGALEDTETLTAILESENAIDYLVRSTTFASDVTSDLVAMTGIGADNYASNTLLADATWRTAICNSASYTAVLNVSVPTMTSDNLPSGTCISSGAVAGLEAYKAFDNNSSTFYASSSLVGNGEYLGYEFTNTITACKYFATIRNNTGVTFTENDIVQGSDDGLAWTDLATYSVVLSGGSGRTANASGVIYGTYKYYRIYRTSGNDRLQVVTFQINGRADV